MDSKKENNDNNDDDKEASYGRLIAEGDADRLASFLKEHTKEESFLMGTLATEKFGQTLHGKSVSLRIL